MSDLLNEGYESRLGPGPVGVCEPGVLLPSFSLEGEFPIFKFLLPLAHVLLYLRGGFFRAFRFSRFVSDLRWFWYVLRWSEEARQEGQAVRLSRLYGFGMESVVPYSARGILWGSRERLVLPSFQRRGCWVPALAESVGRDGRKGLDDISDMCRCGYSDGGGVVGREGRRWVGRALVDLLLGLGPVAGQVR